MTCAQSDTTRPRPVQESLEANPDLFEKMAGTLMPAEDLIDQGADVISPVPLIKSFHNNQVAT